MARVLTALEDFSDSEDDSGGENSLSPSSNGQATSPTERSCSGSAEEPVAAQKKKKKKKNRKKKILGTDSAVTEPGADNSGVGGRGSSSTTGVPSSKSVVMNCTKDVSRNVAKAAGVDWADDEPTPRMVELQKRHDAIVDVAEAGKLTLLNIKAYGPSLSKRLKTENQHLFCFSFHCRWDPCMCS